MVDKWQSVNPTGWATASHKPHTLAKLGADSDGSNQSLLPRITSLFDVNLDQLQ